MKKVFTTEFFRSKIGIVLPVYFQYYKKMDDGFVTSINQNKNPKSRNSDSEHEEEITIFSMENKTRIINFVLILAIFCLFYLQVIGLIYSLCDKY